MNEDRYWFALIYLALGIFQLIVAAVIFVLIVYIAELFI